MNRFIDYLTVRNKNNYTCTYNPNPNFKPDCTGTSTSSNTTGGSTKAPVATLLPKITKNFTLYKNMLPITIPSTVDPLNTKQKYDPSDYSSIKQYFLKPDEYNYNDLSNTTTWDGFKKAISKCTELENCYAVIVQSDFSGISIDDSNREHSFNYFLVELPTIKKINDTFRKFADNKQIDNNFLFCQPQFYTWVKNSSSGVYNPYAPGYKPSSTPSTSFSLSCDPEKYPEQQREEDTAKMFAKKEDDNFWTPRYEVPIPFVPPPKKPKDDNSKRNMIIGVVVAIIVLGGGYYWYTNFGSGSTPNATPSVSKIVPPVIPKTVSTTIKKTKGGYFFY